MQKRTIVIFRLILNCPIFRLGAVSTTGHGESITKVCLAHRVVQAMQARAPKEVSQNVIKSKSAKWKKRLTSCKGGARGPDLHAEQGGGQWGACGS